MNKVTDGDQAVREVAADCASEAGAREGVVQVVGEVVLPGDAFNEDLYCEPGT